MSRDLEYPSQNSSSPRCLKCHFRLELIEYTLPKLERCRGICLSNVNLNHNTGIMISRLLGLVVNGAILPVLEIAATGACPGPET